LILVIEAIKFYRKKKLHHKQKKLQGKSLVESVSFAKQFIGATKI